MLISNTVEPLYNGHHWDPTFCPLQRGVPNSGASVIFPVGVVLRNPAVEYNVAAFSELSFAVRWQGRLSRDSTTSNSTNLMLTIAAMVDNLAEKSTSVR